jgi:hypothetical protein
MTEQGRQYWEEPCLLSEQNLVTSSFSSIPGEQWCVKESPGWHGGTYVPFSACHYHCVTLHSEVSVHAWYGLMVNYPPQAHALE